MVDITNRLVRIRALVERISHPESGSGRSLPRFEGEC